MKRPPKKKPIDDDGVIEVQLTDAEFIMLAKEAHRQNVTFNHLCERLIVRHLLTLP